MFNPEIFAVNFARTVELLRSEAPNKEQQKASLRAVFALTSLASGTVRLYDGVLSVDDTVLSEDLPYTAGLRRQMEGHAVAEVALARGTSATELLALLKALAVDVGGFEPGDGVRERMAALGVQDIAVLGAHRDEEDRGGRRAPSVTQAFDLAAIEESEAAATALAAAQREVAGPVSAEPEKARPHSASLDAAEALLAELEAGGKQTASVEWLEPAAAESQVPEPATPEPVAADLASEPPPSVEAAPEVEEALGGGGDDQEAAAGPVDAADSGATAALSAPHGVPSDTPLGAALGALTFDPYGEGVLDRLSELEAEVAESLREGRLELSVQAITAVIGLEPGAPEGTPKNSYGIVLRRILTREAIKRVGQLLPDPRYAPLATAVVTRAGADGAEVLADLLSAAEAPKERRAYLVALRDLPHGKAALTQLLGHAHWVVVRNVAELLGEVQFEEAVPELGKLLSYHQPRVRRAAAVALARIGSVATVEPLRRAMRDGTPELRALVAASIGGSRARALAMPLVTLAQTEEDEEVLCEYYRALGRIGSPEAVDALVKAAQPGGRFFGRRPTAPRVAAVEGLRSAGGPPAQRALGSLRDDSDKAVREAVLRALDLPSS